MIKQQLEKQLSEQYQLLKKIPPTNILIAYSLEKIYELVAQRTEILNTINRLEEEIKKASE